MTPFNIIHHTYSRSMPGTGTCYSSLQLQYRVRMISVTMNTDAFIASSAVL